MPMSAFLANKRCPTSPPCGRKVRIKFQSAVITEWLGTERWDVTPRRKPTGSVVFAGKGHGVGP